MNRRGPKILGEKKDQTQVVFKAPIVVVNAVKAAAQGNYESPSAYIRRVVVERLRADGLLPAVKVEP